MTNSRVHIEETKTLHGWTASELRDDLALYHSRVLSETQSLRMTDAMKELVLSSEPQTPIDARALMGSLAAFLAWATDAEGDDVCVLLTPEAVARFSHCRTHPAFGSTTMKNHVGRLERLLRVQAGLPSRVRSHVSNQLQPEPLDAEKLSRVLAACESMGPAAMRGLVAAIVGGAVGSDFFGARFLCVESQPLLMLVSGERRALLAMCAPLLSACGDGVLRDGDWDEFRRAAISVRVFVDAAVARQTFRSLVFSLDEPFVVVMRRYQMTPQSIERLLPYFEPVEMTPNVVEMLRGACASGDVEHVSVRPSLSGVSEGGL